MVPFSLTAIRNGPLIFGESRGRLNRAAESTPSLPVRSCMGKHLPYFFSPIPKAYNRHLQISGFLIRL